MLRFISTIILFCFGINDAYSASSSFVSIPRVRVNSIIMDVDTCRRKLNGIEWDFEYMERVGPRANLSLLVIVKDRDSKTIHVIRAFYLLCQQKINRSAFHNIALRRLSDKEESIRGRAANLLGQIGSPKDCVPLAVLLCDPWADTSRSAARAMAAIGDESALIAFDAWLNFESPRKKAYLDHVTEFRNVLAERLKREKAEKEKQVPKK